MKRETGALSGAIYSDSWTAVKRTTPRIGFQWSMTSGFPLSG